MRIDAPPLVLAAVLAVVACGDDPAGGGSSLGGSGGQAVGSGGQVLAGSAGSTQAGQSGVAGSGGAALTSDGGSSGTSDGGSAGSSVSDAGKGNAPVAKPVCPPGPFPAPVVGASQSICAGLQYNNTFNEGPTWIAGQNAFFFTNFLQGQAMHGDIIKYTPGGTCEVFIDDVGCNGLAAAADGNLLAACHQSRSVIKFDVVTKQPTKLADMYMGKMLDTPNDLVAHSNGSIYFTNPTYELQGRPEGVGQAIFWRDPTGVLTAIAMGGTPNGIALSPDEKRLYVIGGGTWDIDNSGAPSNKQNTFVTGDGMALDCAGNVYLSGGSIRSAQGDNLGTFPEGTNLAFGGADGKTLLVVGDGTKVRAIAMNVPGLP